MTSPPPPKPAAIAGFFRELGAVVRPYAVFILKDWLIAVLLWATLWTFHLITSVAKVEGWAGEFIVAVHAAGVVIAFGVFAALLVWDIVELRRKHA